MTADQMFISIQRRMVTDKSEGAHVLKIWAKQLVKTAIKEAAQYCDDGFNGKMIIEQMEEDNYQFIK